MDYHEIRINGELKTGNIKSKDGNLSIKINDSTGKITFKEGLKISNIGHNTDYMLKSNDDEGNCTFVSRSIPTGEKILFESDTHMIGYELLTNIDDVVVYITKGTGSSGPSGGSIKGDWDLPGITHTHSISSQGGHGHTTGYFTLTTTYMPQHYHQLLSTEISNYDLSSSFYVQYTWSDGSRSYLLVSSGTTANRSKTSNTGSGGSHNHGTTVNNSSHDHGGTGAATYSSTWRPVGRNYTRQKRVV